MSAVMRKWKQVPVNWHDITIEAQHGRLTQFLEERDEITYIDKAGIARTVVAAKVTDTGVLFTAKDLHDRRPMYNRLTGKLLSWAESDDRKIMNTEDLALLPDDLVAEITPRRIVQLIGGEEVVTEDKLWRPSATEMFGRGEWGTECDGPDEEQLPIFKTEADRVKNFGDETWWYATRSPLSSSTTNFCTVYAQRLRIQLLRDHLLWRRVRLLDRLHDLTISRPAQGRHNLRRYAWTTEWTN